jgi:3-methyladenine DNA glycosylase AlkD
MSVVEELRSFAEPSRVEALKKYFQVTPGGYGYGDRFIGVRVPNQRAVSKKYFKAISLVDLSKLISSEIHEYRLTGVFMLVLKFEKEKSDTTRKELVDFYIDHLQFMNNWDLVDSSSYKILGVYLSDKNPKMLYDFAYSDDLWKQRVSIVSTYGFIRHFEYDHTFEISKILLHHNQDIIHKAVGWMLKEVGKRDFEKACEFMEVYYSEMPRIMLRFAIEKYPEETRQDFLRGRI